MAKITHRKRRRVAREWSAKEVGTSESDGGSSSDDGEERRRKTRRATREDTKGKGKELVSEEDEFDDEDESSESDEENEERAGVDQMAVVAATEQPTTMCGICLTEGENERGKLDCCEHYFCFACIMEWSKVESKCPMCKQRFTTVMRPAVSGVPRSRVRCIRIPTRDQVYEPSEEEIRLFTDPYQNTVCTQCQEAGDESLLLLCDQCDAAAHTYCVGLGRSVPRGDWFCDACILMSDNSEEDDVDYEEETAVETVCEEEGSDAERTLAFMVSDPDTPVQLRTRSSRTMVTRAAVPSLRRSNRRSGRSGVFATRAPDGVPSRHRRSVLPPLAEPYAARTLFQQRQVHATVHNRLQNMRENWGRFQSGEMQFPSVSNSVASTRPASEAGDVPSSSIPGPVSSEIETAAHRTSSSNGVVADAGDVSRAWTNMDRAMRCSSSTSGTSRLGSRETAAETRARTRERLLHTNANLRTVSLGAGPTQIGGANARAGPEKKSWQEDGDHRTSYIDEQIDFLTSQSSGSRDCDLRRSARLESARKADKPIEDYPAGILHSSCDNSRSGYNLRESSRQQPTRGGLHARETSANVLVSPTSRGSRDNSRESGGSWFLSRRDSRDGQSLQDNSGSILDWDNTRGSTGVTNRRRDVKSSTALDDWDSSRSSTGPVTRRSSARNPERDEKVKVMKEQCLAFVELALKPMLSKRTIDRDQYKDLARTANHTILTELGVSGLTCASNVTMGTVTCEHEEPTSSSLIPGCCNACVQRHVRKFVKNLVRDTVHLHRSRM